MREDSDLIYIGIPWALLDPWELAGYLAPYLGYSSSVYTVYDRSLEGWLSRRGMKKWWQAAWPYPEYWDFSREDYGKYLLEKGLAQMGRPEHILVLGFQDFVPGMLRSRLRYTKTLRFFVEENFSEEKSYGALEDFIEEIYDEYGLAAALDTAGRPSAGKSPAAGRNSAAGGDFVAGRFSVSGSSWKEPVLVLDFAGGAGRNGEKKWDDNRIGKESGRGLTKAVWTLAAQAAPGSVWLDMRSMEEKRRRIESGGKGVLYFSMKKEWEQQGKLFGASDIQRFLTGIRGMEGEEPLPDPSDPGQKPGSGEWKGRNPCRILL